MSESRPPETSQPDPSSAPEDSPQPAPEEHPPEPQAADAASPDAASIPTARPAARGGAGRKTSPVRLTVGIIAGLVVIILLPYIGYRLHFDAKENEAVIAYEQGRYEEAGNLAATALEETPAIDAARRERLRELAVRSWSAAAEAPEATLLDRVELLRRAIPLDNQSPEAERYVTESQRTLVDRFGGLDPEGEGGDDAAP